MIICSLAKLSGSVAQVDWGCPFMSELGVNAALDACGKDGCWEEAVWFWKSNMDGQNELTSCEGR